MLGLVGRWLRFTAVLGGAEWLVRPGPLTGPAEPQAPPSRSAWIRVLESALDSPPTPYTSSMRLRSAAARSASGRLAASDRSPPLQNSSSVSG